MFGVINMLIINYLFTYVHVHDSCIYTYISKNDIIVCYHVVAMCYISDIGSYILVYNFPVSWYSSKLCNHGNRNIVHT